MKPVLILITLLGLTACGADGEPIAPEPAQTGITISGEARIGIKF